tara:strand:- start:15127 stop:15246 length:120 start_codon:yes stop_codon:yes gene_type:complete
MKGKTEEFSTTYEQIARIIESSQEIKAKKLHSVILHYLV